MEDYFGMKESCELGKEVPRYFYYKGTTFEIDFSKLDSVHEQILALKSKGNLDTT